MTYIHRALEQELLAMSKAYPVVTLIGPRQSGKTTLVKQLFADKPYVSLENIDERTFAEIDPRSFLARYPDGAVLDEIQSTPQLLSYLQEKVDIDQRCGLFILTGSHQLALHESISQSLAGRTAVLKLWPFSLDELADQQSPFDQPDEYIYRGMYPRPYKNKMTPTKYYRDYVQTYIERDVRKIINIKDLSLFQRFMKLCAGRTGQIFNSHQLSNELGVSHHTVQNWISVLEASFIIFKLTPYFENFGKRLIKSPKLYFVDAGLAAYLLDIASVAQLTRDPLRGALIENFVIAEAMKSLLNSGIEPNLYYFRDSNGSELDLIMKSGHQLIPLEIKAAKTFHKDFFKGLDYFKVLTRDRCSQGYLFYSGQEEQVVGNFFVKNFHAIGSVIHHIMQAANK